MSVITGVNGAINGINCVQRFVLVEQSQLASFVCSATDGAEGNIAGNKDWQVLYSAYGHTPQVMPGDAFAFIGGSRDGKGHSGAAIGTKVRVVWPVAAGRPPIWHQVWAGGNGLLSHGAYVATDASTPSPKSPQQLTMSLDGSDVAEIQRMELVIEKPAKAYVSSDTSGLVMRSEGNLTAQVTGHCLFDNPADLPVVNTAYSLRLNVTTVPAYWALNWVRMNRVKSTMIIEDMGEHQAQHWACEFSGEWTGYKDGSTGFITTPAGVTYWP